jgi:hypothetical protein
MKYGLEFEFFVFHNNVVVPAYLATSNLDGDPFIGEVKTSPVNTIVDAVFQLDKLIYLEQQELKRKGYEMKIAAKNQFSDEQLRVFRKDRAASSFNKLEILEEFSIYPSGQLGKLLQRGEKKASLQINLSENIDFLYDKYDKIQFKKEYIYNSTLQKKTYSTLFNYIDIIQNLDQTFKDDIEVADRVSGIYSIKDGEFGKRIEYRSLPNTVDYKKLISLF